MLPSIVVLDFVTILNVCTRGLNKAPNPGPEVGHPKVPAERSRPWGGKPLPGKKAGPSQIQLLMPKKWTHQWPAGKCTPNAGVAALALLSCPTCKWGKSSGTSRGLMRRGKRRQWWRRKRSQSKKDQRGLVHLDSWCKSVCEVWEEVYSKFSLGQYSWPALGECTGKMRQSGSVFYLAGVHLRHWRQLHASVIASQETFQFASFLTQKWKSISVKLEIGHMDKSAKNCFHILIPLKESVFNIGVCVSRMQIRVIVMNAMTFLFRVYYIFI